MNERKGFFGNNPLLKLGLGVCPALAVTTTAINGLGMGCATACVLVLTCLVMGLIGRALTDKARLAVTLIVSAAFATLAQMILKGWFGALYEALGIFVPLIAVSSLILCRAGEDAEKGVGAALADGVLMGVGYIIALTVVGVLRELLAKGTIFGAAILPACYEPFVLAALPAGGLLIVGLCMGVYRAATGRKGKEGA